MDKKRCEWANSSKLMREYHDKEWGKLTKDDKKIFEFLVLESAQAGLSWSTILKKREGYRNAFSNFDPIKVSKYKEKDVERLLKNEEIIKNRLKIVSAINNAKRFLEIQKEFGSFFNYIKTFTKGKKFPIINTLKDVKNMPAKTKLSEEISKDMKKRGFKFLGPVIIYSHLQATGIIDDHAEYCFRKNKK